VIRVRRKIDRPSRRVICTAKMTEQDISNNKPSKTLKDFQNVYAPVESWYATLKGKRKTWVDDNWKSMLENFIEYAEQSLEESISEEDKKEEEKEETDEEIYAEHVVYIPEYYTPEPCDCMYCAELRGARVITSYNIQNK